MKKVAGAGSVKKKVARWQIVKWKKAAKAKKAGAAPKAGEAKKPRVEVVRVFAGNPPDRRKGWFQMGTCISREPGDGVKVVWDVWCLPEAESSDWIGIKVVAKKTATRKANYWLAYNLVERRLQRNAEAGILRNRRPDLEKAVVDAIEDYQDYLNSDD